VGAWGYGIFENDDAYDVKQKMTKYMKNGTSALEAMRECMKEYCLFMDDINVVLAIATLEMEHQCLEPHIRKQCLAMIAEQRDEKRWKDPEKRFRVLEEIKQKLLKY
jgi:hypothetical protein